MPHHLARRDVPKLALGTTAGLLGARRLIDELSVVNRTD